MICNYFLVTAIINLILIISTTLTFAGDNQFSQMRIRHELLAKQYEQKAKQLCATAQSNCLKNKLMKEMKLDCSLELYHRKGIRYEKFNQLPPLTPFRITGRVRQFYKIIYYKDNKVKTALVVQKAIRQLIESNCKTLFLKCNNFKK